MKLKIFLLLVPTMTLYCMQDDTSSDEPARINRFHRKESPRTLVESDFPLRVISAPANKLTMKERREKFAQKFNNLSDTQKTELVINGVFNSPKTGRLKKSFAHLTDQQRDDFTGKYLKIPTVDIK